MKRLHRVILYEKRKLVGLWLIISIFLLFFGGAINPLTASEQFKRRMQLPSLLDPKNPDVSTLNDTFELFLQESEKYAKTRDQFSTLAEYETQMVEIFTYMMTKHKTDLIQHLTVDHFPTTSEVMRSGVDDEDGRSILAASLLLYRGHDAWVLFGPWHSWVKVFLRNGNHLHILAKKGIGMNFWYLRFNDHEVHFNPIQTVVYVCYEVFLAALIIGVLFYVKKMSQSSFVRQVTKNLSIFVVVTFFLFLVGFIIILLFYRIIWGV